MSVLIFRRNIKRYLPFIIFLNTLRPRQDGRYFCRRHLQMHFLLQWKLTGNKPLSELSGGIVYRHIYASSYRWVNAKRISILHTINNIATDDLAKHRAMAMTLIWLSRNTLVSAPEIILLWYIFLSVILKHSDLTKTIVILQTIFSYSFSWKKILVFWFEFHLSMFLWFN